MPNAKTSPAKGGAATPAATETKNAKFRRISVAKGTKAAVAIRNCAVVATKAYDYSEAEAKAFMAGIEAEVIALGKKLFANIRPAEKASAVVFDPFAALDNPAPQPQPQAEPQPDPQPEAPAATEQAPATA